MMLSEPLPMQEVCKAGLHPKRSARCFECRRLGCSRFYWKRELLRFFIERTLIE